MKITRPLWAKGIFMTPQHFQQQAMWEQYAHDRVARIASPDAWGTLQVALDSRALAASRLQCTALALRLPDGTLIDSETADWLPAPRSLDDVPASLDAVTVLAGVALMDAQGGNCVEAGEKPARPRRFTREYRQVADLNGEGHEEISVERQIVSLLFDFEQTGDYVTCPIARLVRGPQGRFEADTAFVPPCLALSANDTLVQRAQRLSEILSAKSASLAVRRKERSDQIADFAVSDVALFWLLHSIHSAWPELARLVQAPDQHPERLYAVLARLAGSLLTFSTTETLQAIPLYDHHAPEPTFAELESLIRALLDTVIPSRVVPIALERMRPTTWSGRINDERLVDGAEYYLSVQAAMPAHALLEQLPRLCKVGAPDEVEQIVNSALPGIALLPMARLPAAIPVRIENQYFALDITDAAFKRMVNARACQIYVPVSIPDASLELYAVLPS
ncbi:type VI secretion system baseplate subunit TssK [Burkholderia sp. Ac-20344]|uniref:type VI secretion system baseplate subunit TssK n=1 Tax=Burkholderia sp. Ac-20344 TaxID=2703890 RepID=UPI00197B3237|nr:type VI secretion system baseplate subunit TssK [Burkholderia sp. Ac-20344]MBN3830779.1 type VI secretion system baseplate subunit TssK [Burkholderia sp. Ac-20344]